MTVFYFTVLCGLWHIPSFTGELSVRIYAAVQASLFSVFCTPEKFLSVITPRSIIE